MPYRVPSFPLQVNIWHNLGPPVWPPDVQTVGNMCASKRVTLEWFQVINGVAVTEPRFLLLPAGTDVRDGRGVLGADVLTLGAAAVLDTFIVLGVVDVAKGFPNEYRRARILPLSDGSWSEPYVFA